MKKNKNKQGTASGDKVRVYGYEVTPLEYGFKITPRGEDSVDIDIEATLDIYTGFWEIVEKKHYPGESWHVRMFEYYNLSDTCVELIYKNWEISEEKRKQLAKKGYNGNYAPVYIQEWMRKKTGKTLNARLLEEWKKQIKKVPTEVQKLHKRLFSLTGGKGEWSNVRSLLKSGNEYFIEDIMKYSAAGIALLDSHPFPLSPEHSDDWLHNINELGKNWLGYFSNTGEKYKTLNRTIMNLPKGLTSRDILSLKKYPLKNPLLTRYKLLAANEGGEHFYIKEKFEKIMAVVYRSTEEEIKKALLFMWESFPDLNPTKDFRRLRAIRDTLSMIFDYPYELIGEWDILGLVKRSEKYHHDEELRKELEAQQFAMESARNRALFEVIKNSNTATPPIDLPNDDNIRFISSYAEVLKEGEKMNHCVASYARGAVEGRCYLFHVDHKGECATIELAPDGHVRQSRGVSNENNVASEYGRRILTKWGKGIQGKAPILHFSIPEVSEKEVQQTILVNKTFELEEIPF